MPCSGDTPPCIEYGEYECEMCGCEWDYGLERCTGMPHDCSYHENQYNCEDCYCDWTAPGIQNVKINVGDVWKNVSEMKINVGDTWKTVVEIKINIGDTWKTVYTIF
jgi:hypothetical protein